MTLKLFHKPSRPNLKGFIRMFLAFAFATICALIIMPQIDHQPWYPDKLRKFDVPAGIEFEPHRRTSIDISQSSLTRIQIRQLSEILQRRLKSADIQEAELSLTDKALTINMPESYSEYFSSAVTAAGDIQFMAPKEGIDFQQDLAAAFDIQNFETTDLKREHISGARITAETDTYTYIELRIEKSQKEKWDSFAAKYSSQIIGFFVDGEQHLAWILSAEANQAKHPSLVITDMKPESGVILSYISDGPLPIGTVSSTSEIKEAQYSKDLLYSATLAGLLFISLCTILRNVLLKESFWTTVSVVLVLAGILAIVKITAIPVTLPFIVTATTAGLLFATTRTQLHIPICISLFLIGAGLSLVPSASLASQSRFLMIFGFFGALTVIFYQFFNIYEEE